MDAPGIRQLAGYIFSSAIALFVLGSLASATQEYQVATAERARKRVEATEVVCDRIGGAIDAIGNIHIIVRNTPPEQLPELAASSFNTLAQFCAGWLAPERRRFWTLEERDVLLTTNKAVFEFLLALEINKKPDLVDIAQRADTAKQLLEKAWNKFDLGK